MKKQLLVLTALLALLATNSVIAQIPSLDPNNLLNAQKLEDTLKAISKESNLMPSQTSNYKSPIDSGTIKQIVETSIRYASTNVIKNAVVIAAVLKETDRSAIDQLDTLLSTSQLTSKDIDQLINVLTKLYNGDSYTTIIGSQGYGFNEGAVGKTFALIANAANYLTKLYSNLENLLGGIAAHYGGAMEKETPMQRFIEYAIGKLTVYKSLPKISENSPK